MCDVLFDRMRVIHRQRLRKAVDTWCMTRLELLLETMRRDCAEHGIEIPVNKEAA